MALEEKPLYYRKQHIPVFDERQSEEFDTCLQRLGRWNTTGKSMTNDGAPGIIRLHWIIPGEQWCDEGGMLQFLDQRLHRQVLRWFLHSSPLSKEDRFAFLDEWGQWDDDERTTWKTTDLVMALGQESDALFPILRFLELQEYLVEVRDGVWTGGPALASIYNLGPTLEWCVQAHFQRRHHAIARRCVHFTEWESLKLNDLDVLVFTNDLVLTAECKSSTDIKPGHLQRFVRRAQSFPADIALLLIDTDSLSSVTARVNQIQTILGSEAHQEEHIQHEGSLITFLPSNIYVANSGESISQTLESILHHHGSLQKKMRSSSSDESR